MRKYTKIFCLIIALLILIPSVSSLALSSSMIKNININALDLNSIDESKKDDLKKALSNIEEKLSESEIKEIVSEVNKVSNNTVNTNSVNMDTFLDIYNELSNVVSNEEIANLIEDNSNLLNRAGMSDSALSAAESIFRNFDTDAIVDVVKNDLDMDEIVSLYNNDASLEDIMSSVITGTSMQAKINIIFKLLLSNKYVKGTLIILLIVAVYSIFVTALIFKKAGKHAFATIIPIYRDVVHLKVCHLSPWLLLLVLIPILGWIMLLAVAIIARFELSKSFGHGFFFGLGLLLFPILFRSIIAFSKNEYVENLD